MTQLTLFSMFAPDPPEPAERVQPEPVEDAPVPCQVCLDPSCGGH